MSILEDLRVAPPERLLEMPCGRLRSAFDVVRSPEVVLEFEHVRVEQRSPLQERYRRIDFTTLQVHPP